MTSHLGGKLSNEILQNYSSICINIAILRVFRYHKCTTTFYYLQNIYYNSGDFTIYYDYVIFTNYYILIMHCSYIVTHAKIIFDIKEPSVK